MGDPSGRAKQRTQVVLPSAQIEELLAKAGIVVGKREAEAIAEFLAQVGGIDNGRNVLRQLGLLLK